MTSSPAPGRPQKAKQRLSKQIILQSALPIVQEQGAEALTFRGLAERLGVTPMAVAYHSGSKRDLLADLVDFAFEGTLDGLRSVPPKAHARAILRAYYLRARLNANLLRAVLEDTSLMGSVLVEITDELNACTRKLDGKDDNVLLHLLIDYTHGFVLSAASGQGNLLTVDGYLRGIDWILARTGGPLGG